LTFEALLDGEIVVVDDEGYPDFQMLQDYRKSRKGHLIYYVFDLLHLGGHDLTNLPLMRRKELLRKVLPSLPGIRFTDHIWKNGIAFFNVVSEKGLEGIVAKNLRSVYRTGKRSLQWLKVKTHDTQDAVIGGFTEPGGLRKHFGALVLGVYEKDDLMYIGHTGGGFSAKTLAEIRGRLEPLIRRTCPFKIEPKTNRAVTWVEPDLVCEVNFHGWTADGVMRQPTFVRMRDDKSARDVMREKPPAGGEDTGGAP
jgi:bifunctional non-homologous end joining protein LigD